MSDLQTWIYDGPYESPHYSLPIMITESNSVLRVRPTWDI